MRMMGIYKSNNNFKENLINETIAGFEEYLRTTTNATTLTVFNEGRHIDGSLQDATFNNRTYGDEKIFLCRINEILEVGDYVLWKKKPFLVTAEDRNTSPTHKTFIIRPCNNVIDVEVNGELRPLYLVIDGSIAKFKETDTIAMHNDELRMVMGNCAESETLKENSKVILKGKRFRITSIEDLTANYLDYKAITYAYIKRELNTSSDAIYDISEEDKEDKVQIDNSISGVMNNMFGKKEGDGNGKCR